MKKNSLYILFFACTLTSLFSSISVAPDKKATPISDQEFEELLFTWTRTWAEVMQLIRTKHYKPVSPEQCMTRSLEAFLGALDPHSNFLDQKAYSALLETTSGEFYGIGIVIDNTRKTKDRFLTIVEIIPDGPAEKAGMQQYDKIVEVDGLPLEGLSTDEIIKKMRGEKGSSVTIKIMREGHQDLIIISVIRDAVKTHDSLSFHLKNQHLCYISLITFSDNAVTQMRSLLQKSKNQKYRGIILDLRNNSGGLLTAVVDIASLFVPKNSLITKTKDKNNTVTSEYKTAHDPIADPTIPIVILVNNYTASAAEILGRTLQLYAEQNNGITPPLVFIIGTPTFGKGSVQEVIPISNNSAISLTTSLYFFPDDSTIQAVGIQPDFVIERYSPPTEQVKWFLQSYGREKTLDNYIIINEKEEEESTKKELIEFKKNDSSLLKRAKEMLLNDNQLREAIIMLQIINTGRIASPDAFSSRESAYQYLKNIYIINKDIDIEEIKA